MNLEKTIKKINQVQKFFNLSLIFHRMEVALLIALEAIRANKFRSGLSALGIIFGVSAFIAMLAIGKGAKQEIMDQIKLVGVNNIVITPKIIEQDNDGSISSPGNKKGIFKGITLSDAQSIKACIASVKLVSPEVVNEITVIRKGRIQNTKLIGVNLNFFKLFNYKLSKGHLFNQRHLQYASAVCVIGKQIQAKMFSQEDPIGKWIKCNNIWLNVIGVLKPKNVSTAAVAELGIRDVNTDIYTPIKTLLIRFKNRGLITAATLKRKPSENQEPAQSPESYSQLDKLVVQVEQNELLNSITNVIARMLKRRHHGMVDFEIKIPELLLKQQQRTKEIFNIVLGTIASISLIVGGIGIMNIMLASIMERIREIGLRLALGATKRDIVLQFLAESVFISLTGGIIGVVLGVMVVKVITKITGILAIISISSIIISFGVAVLVGLIFGIMPAKRAAENNPADSLRYE